MSTSINIKTTIMETYNLDEFGNEDQKNYSGGVPVNEAYTESENTRSETTYNPDDQEDTREKSADEENDEEDNEAGDWGNIDPQSNGLPSENDPSAPGSAV